MINVKTTQIVPQNIDLFISEIGGALRAMYGAEAQATYARTARAGYAQLFAHPEVQVFAPDEVDPPGLLVSMTRRGIGHITLLHVLEKAAGKGIETALINAAVRDMRERGLRAIIGEFIRHRPLAIDDAFIQLGFSRFDRQVLIADLDNANLKSDLPAESVPCDGRDALAANVLVDAYQDHPSRPLHPEAQDTESAKAFLAGFREGSFGATAPELYRLWMDRDTCTGLILGAEAAPGVGFIPHVAVARSAQGQGIGARLIRETAAIFRQAGYGRVALGVTKGNPAERLYERLGFEPLMPVETYAWWAKSP